MIQKGKIEKVIDRYTYKVRIPKYDKIQDDASGTDTEDLADGLVCITPGVNVSYALGDIVIVSFENDEISKPIILGLLYRENSNNIDSETSLISVDENLEGISSKISNLKSSSNIYTHLKYSNDNGLTFTSLYNPNMYERTDSLGNIYCSPAYSSRSVQGIEIDKKSKIITWFISDENNNDVTDQIGIETTLFDSNGNTLRVIPREEKNYSIILNNLSQVEDKLYMTYKIYVTKEHLDRLNVVLSTDRNTLGTQEGNYLGIYVSNNNIPSLEPSDYRWFSFAASGMSDEIAEVISELESTTGELIEQMTEVSSDIDGFRISVAEAVTMAQNVQEAAERGDFDGVGILSTEITYQESASNITVPSGTWYDEEHIPQVPDGHYLWTKTYVTYTNNTHSTSYSVAKQGVKGDTGDSGLNTASVLLYQRGSTAPTKPVGNLIYTFATGDITTDPNDPTSNLNSWTKNIPAIDGHPCWVISATASANTATDIIEDTDWSSQIKFVEDGESGGIGAHGINTAPIYLYQRSSTTPSKPTNTLTYTFSTKTISGTIDNNWLANIGSLTGDSPIWIIGAVASSNTDTTTVGNSDWSTPIKLSENGEDGESISSVTNYYLATSASSGVTPSTTGWTTTIQTMDATNQYLWNYEVITGSNSSTISTTTPVIIGRYGQDGNQGPSGSDGKGIASIVEWYQISDDNIHPPATPSAQGTGYSSSPVLTTISNPYLWNYEVISYTSGNPTITDARVIGTHGEDGVDGLNQATVYIYKRSSTTPEEPSESGTYTFSTGQLTGDIIDEEGWRTYVPSGTEPCYVCTGLAISRGTTATIDSWSDVVKFVENGTNGVDGYNQATLNLYQRATSSPSKPSDGTTTYSFSDNRIINIPSGWSTSIPAGTDPCWCTSAVAISREASVNLTWSTPIKLVQDGQAGLNQATINLYKRGTSATTPPASRYKFSIGSLVDSSGNPISSLQGWTRNLESGSEQAWMSSASVIGREDIVNIPSWSTPIRLVKDGTPATQYYTHIRYSANADGSNYVDTPTSSTKYIGIYVGTSSTAPAYNNSGWKWNKYLGEDGSDGTSVTVQSIVYAKTTIDSQPSSWPYSEPPQISEGEWLWSRVTLSDGNTIISKSYSGISGTDGYNQATIYLYNRSASVSSSMPSVNVYYRFSDGKFSINNSTWTDTLTTGSGSNQRIWTKYIPSVDDTHPEYSCWVISAVAISQDDIDDIATNEWTGPNKYSENGLNQAVVRMYKRSVSAPTDRPNNTLTYRFSNGVLTPSSAFNGWTQEVPPSDSNKNPCWFIAAVASSRGNTDDITVQEWQNFTPIKFMTDGIGILRIEEEYRLSTSDQSLVPESSVESKYIWNTVQPAYEDGKYYWVRQHIYYDNNTDNYSTPVCDKSINGAVDHVINHVQQHYLSTADFSVEKDKIQSRVARTELELIGQYALCQTASTTAAKEATIIPQDQSWTLQTDTEITVQFEYRNTTDNPTLKINNQPQNGASLKDKDGNNLTEEQLHWEAGSIFLFKYDGTNWRLQDNLKLERLDNDETLIQQTANNVLIRATQNDTTAAQGGQHIIESLINVAPQGVQISAEKVNIAGATIFNSYATKTYAETQASNAQAAAEAAAAQDATSKANAAKNDAISAAAQDATSKANAAETNAKGYADTQVGVVAGDLSDLSGELTTYKNSTDAAITALQDGQIELWYKAVDPTLTNEPASTWETTAEKDRHLDDLYYNTETGHSWRWKKDGSVYSWQQIPDSDAAAALARANEAATLAGNKRRIFTSTPTVPYDSGDLWVNGNVVKYCTQSRASNESYSSSDWSVTANNITDISGLTDTTNVITNAVDAGVATTVKSVSVENEYRLSTSTTQLLPKNSQLDKYNWRTTIPTWEIDNYIWNRVKTTYVYVNDTSHVDYTPGTNVDPTYNEYGVYDSQLTTALSNASTALTNAGIAQQTADSAANTIITTQEYRLSNSSQTLDPPDNPEPSNPKYIWSSTIPVWEEDTYIWTRFKIEKTTVGSPSSITEDYTPSISGIYDSALTEALSTANVSMNSMYRQQTLYCRTKADQDSPSLPQRWFVYDPLDQSAIGYNSWSLQLPELFYNNEEYPLIWYCIQSQTSKQYIANLGECYCTSAVLDNSISGLATTDEVVASISQAVGDLSNEITNIYSTKENTIVRSQKIYYQGNSISQPQLPGNNPNTDWITNSASSGNVYNTWVTRHVEYSKEYPYTWVCEQYESYRLNQSNLLYTPYLYYTPVLRDDTTTVIDGGNIITGSVTTSQLRIDDYITFMTVPVPITNVHNTKPEFHADTFGVYNSVTDEYTKLTTEPLDWNYPNDEWKSYYTYEQTIPYMLIGKKGEQGRFAITINDKQIAFWEENEKIAFINGKLMSIPKSVMLKEMNIGEKMWTWREHKGNLELRWIGDL